MSMREDDGSGSAAPGRPAYPDEALAALGEELAGLYAAREQDPASAESLASKIADVRRQMRKGPRLLPGEFVADGRYRLMERLARRGVDGFWKAWDSEQQQFVQVRVFYGDWIANPAAIAQFEARGGALTDLDHPGIGNVLDAGRTDDGFVFLATRLVDGEALETAANLDPIDALQAIVEVARALQAAHERGIVHGDLGPSNVFLGADGTVQVTGFSVAPTDGGDMGSLFRAPEMAERGATPEVAGDVYALGMLAMRALNNGELPFWVLRDPGRLVQSLDVPETVRGVLGRAIEWDLGVRYGQVELFLQELLSDPGTVEALIERVRSRGRHSEAVAYDEALLALQPDRAVELRTRLATSYLEIGAHDAAMDHLLEAMKSAPDVAPMFGPLRSIAERNDRWAELAAALEERAPGRDEANRVAIRTELARILQHELDEPKGAQDAWAQVFEEHRTPQSAVTALRALAELGRGRDWATFVQYSESLLSYVPDQERAQIEYAIGRAYIEHLGREELGLEYIDRAEAHGWTEVDLSSRLQQIRAQMGQWQRVVQLMMLQAQSQEIAQASPTLMRAGIIATSVHLEEEAFAVYHALLERAPRHVVALRHLARMHQRAHEPHLALQYYERLWDAYQGKDADEPEASERAADCGAYARLLMRQERPEDAAMRLEEAMRLAPNHVPTLQIAGPLYVDLGELQKAGKVYEQMLSLFKSVELSSQKISACLGMGDIAWLQGRLTAAMGWYNRAIELDPFSCLAWWGLGKVALASRGGHPGADRAPWIGNMPKRFPPEEALARLFAGILSPRSLRAWLNQSPMGQALVAGGAAPMRLACGAVDVMVRNEVVSPDLFDRLEAACPEWKGPIQLVQEMWLGNGAATFPVAQSYTWSSRLVEDDFDATVVRSTLPLTSVAHADPPNEALRAASAWELLLADAQPPPPAPFVPPEEIEARKRAMLPGPVVALGQGTVLWGAMERDRAELTIGTADGCDVRIPEDDAVHENHAVVWRIGDHVYVRSADGAEISVNDLPHDRWRLRMGDVLTVGSTRLDVTLHQGEHTLPAEIRTPPDVARPEEVAALEALLEQEAASTDAPPAPPPLPAPPPPPPVPTVTPLHDDSEDAEVVQTSIDRSEREEPLPSVFNGTAPDVDHPDEDSAGEVFTSEAIGGPPPADALPPPAFSDPGVEPHQASIEPVEPPDRGGPVQPFFSDFPDSEEGPAPEIARDPAPTPLPSGPPSDPPAWLREALGQEDTLTEDPDDSLSLSGDEPATVVGPALDETETPTVTTAPDRVDTPEIAEPLGDLFVGKAWLEYMSGPERGQAVAVGPHLSVGQSHECGMSVPTDSRMSATHCMVQRTSTGFVLRDSGSATGTVVNGQRIDELELQGGETIMVGRTVLRFRMEA